MFLLSNFVALLESLKTQSKNQIAATRENISQAKKINKENEGLTEEHQEYANYLNCLVSKMNDSMATKVLFIQYDSYWINLGFYSNQFRLMLE